MRLRFGARSTPEAAAAAVHGGAVSRERLLAAATRDGRGASPLVRSLLAQSVPSVADLAQAYAASGHALRLDRSFLTLSPRACHLLDAELLRRERCVPIEILADLCILAVEPGRAVRAVQAVRHALQREVVPVLADKAVLDTVLDQLAPPPKASGFGRMPQRDSAVHARFRDLVLDDVVLDALPGRAEERP